LAICDNASSGKVGWIGANPRAKAASAPAANKGTIEDMQTDLLHLFHGERPAWVHIGGVIVRGRDHFRPEDLACGDGHAYLLRHLVVRGAAHARPRAVAGKRELAAVAPVAILVDDAADCRRIGRIADTVEDDLRNSGLALHVFPARLEIDALGQAFL